MGISVDSAVDIAKAAAAVILLAKDHMVLDDGVIEGRKVFVNILKYVRIALPPLYWPILLATLASYVVLTQAVKMWLIRKAWL